MYTKVTEKVQFQDEVQLNWNITTFVHNNVKMQWAQPDTGVKLWLQRLTPFPLDGTGMRRIQETNMTWTTVITLINFNSFCLVCHQSMNEMDTKHSNNHQQPLIQPQLYGLMTYAVSVFIWGQGIHAQCLHSQTSVMWLLCISLLLWLPHCFLHFIAPFLLLSCCIYTVC